MKRLGLARLAVPLACSALLTLAPLGDRALAAQDAPADTGDASPEAAEPVASPLTLESIRVSPERPGEETLCRLEVTLGNRSERAVSALAFEVRVGGVDLPVYRNQLFVEPVDADASTVLQLFNFWTSETGRPLPAGKTLEVRVRLTEARWLSTSADEDGTEVWDLGEKVPGLPLEAVLAVPLDRPGAKAPEKAGGGNG